MQPLELTIPGSYYDSQIYSGRLYLWGNDGSIIILDWDRLVENIVVPERLKLALNCAFLISEYLYGHHWDLVFKDEEIRSTLQRKFNHLFEMSPFEISEEEIENYLVRRQDNPFTFPHSDCTVYNNTIYLGNQNGILSASIDSKRKYPISRNPNKIWDGTALSVAASYSTLAISAGSDGLFEYKLDANSHWTRNHEPRQVIKQHSNFVRWLYASFFSSSYFNEGFLVHFDNKLNEEAEMRERIFREVLSSEKLFGHQTKNGVSSLTWGVHDKICYATPSSVEIIQYAPYKENQEEKFINLGSVNTNSKQKIGDIVSGDSALFGFIIESENGLLIINSLTETIWIDGEPVNWRVFPKSKFYTNQLHVIYDDHISIYSFNHDYFVDQKTKRVGIRHASKPRFGARSIE